MVERFGRDFANWEHVELKLKNAEGANKEVPSISDESSDAFGEIEEKLSEYEQIRLSRIQENQRMLLSLGLISDLSEDSDDVAHYEKLISNESLPPPTLTALIVVPHIRASALETCEIFEYRATIMNIARDAHEKLPPSGIFIVGAQDVRTSDGKLWPLTMLLLEDINRAVGEDKMRLKELVIAVPEGYAKDRRKITSYEEYTEERYVSDGQKFEHLPIVHACYLIFMKLR